MARIKIEILDRRTNQPHKISLERKAYKSSLIGLATSIITSTGTVIYFGINDYMNSVPNYYTPGNALAVVGIMLGPLALGSAPLLYHHFRGNLS